MGLPALASVKLIVPAFYSTHDTRTPVAVASISLVLNIILNIVFLKYFFDYVQNGGPALATAIACFVDFFALFIIFRNALRAVGGRQIFNSFAKIALCSAIMGVACWLGMHYTEFTMHSRFLVQLLTFLALLGGATLLYLGMAWLFRCHEWKRSMALPRAGEPRRRRVGGAVMEIAATISSFPDPRKSGEGAVVQHRLGVPAGPGEIRRFCAEAQTFAGRCVRATTWWIFWPGFIG